MVQRAPVATGAAHGPIPAPRADSGSRTPVSQASTRRSPVLDASQRWHDRCTVWRMAIRRRSEACPNLLLTCCFSFGFFAVATAGCGGTSSDTGDLAPPAAGTVGTIGPGTFAGATAGDSGRSTELGGAGGTAALAADGGFKAAGGTIAASSECTPSQASPSAGCSSDSECPAGQHCDTSGCGSSCSCINGQLQCTNVCLPGCQPENCTPPSPAFFSRIEGEACDFVVRIDQAVSQIVGYRVVCGNAKAVTTTSIEADLFTWSSINWSTATRYGDSSGPAYLYLYGVDERGRYAGTAFSRATGEALFTYLSWTDPDMGGEWSSADEIDGSCTGAGPTPRALGPFDTSDPGQMIMRFLNQRGFFAGIDEITGLRPIPVVLRTTSNPVEYIVIVTLNPIP